NSAALSDHHAFLLQLNDSADVAEENVDSARILFPHNSGGFPELIQQFRGRGARFVRLAVCPPQSLVDIFAKGPPDLCTMRLGYSVSQQVTHVDRVDLLNESNFSRLIGVSSD